MKRITIISSLALIFSTSLSFAGKATDLQPAMAKLGKVMAEDDFGGAQLAKTWIVNKGDWQPKDGVLVGNIKKSDNHPAVLMLNAPNRNSIIRFSFKCDGNKGFNLSYNSAKGHLFRVVVTGDGLTVTKDKDKKDPKSKSIELASAKGKVAAGEWHTLMLEVSGGKVAVQTDFGLKAEASHPELDVDKTGYRFVTGGTVSLDDVRVWSTQ